MKKLLLFLFLSTIGICSFAQSLIEIGRYTDELKKKERVIEALVQNGEFVSLMIEVQGQKYENVHIAVYEPYAFRDAMMKIRDKYAEWNDIAKNNKIVDYNKPISVELPKYNVVWRSGKDLFMSPECNEKFTFVVTKEGISFIMLLGTVKDGTGSDVSEVYSMTFISLSELDNFLSNLDYKSVTTKTTIRDELFK